MPTRLTLTVVAVLGRFDARSDGERLRAHRFFILEPIVFRALTHLVDRLLLRVVCALQVLVVGRAGRVEVLDVVDIV